MTRRWRQARIEFRHWSQAEQVMATQLRPCLARLEKDKLITGWFFIRKAPCWNLRILALAGDSAPLACTAIGRCLDAMTTGGLVTGWAETIYEPETRAFGGPAAMDISHGLFHRDSSHILAYLATLFTQPGPLTPDRRRELALLLAVTLMRSARQDWYEEGDIWARLSQHRALPAATDPARTSAMQAQVRRLITADITAALTDGGSLAFAREWLAAFATTGTQLSDLARAGALGRGLRAVLTHHVLFAWNRLGLPHDTQAHLTLAAKTVVLDQ
jgi:thiopeptide-type bacteriocin biosynthesis protein